MISKTDKLLKDIERLVDDTVTLEELRKKLNSGKQLIIKFGADCTAPFLHLGHAVNLWTMRRFQEDGHKVVFLIGDFTSKIGDPTDRSESRKILSDEEIEKNANEFIKQIGNVLITDDKNVFEIRRNSEWFGKMNVSDFLKLATMITHSKLISRDMFQKRINEAKEIYINEMLYPIIQGYDSVELKSDLTIVGTDQLFNEMMGRFYQEKFDQEPQILITTKITKGLWGEEKQSKSIGNFIALVDTPKDKFGKAMSLSDDRIISWMEVYTDINLDNIKCWQDDISNGKADFMKLKLKLAFEIVKKYHGKEIAQNEYDWFIRTFSKNEFPENAPIIKIDRKSLTLFELLKECLKEQSNSEIRRLINQGGITINDNKMDCADEKIDLSNELKLRIGKKHFFKIIS